MSGWRDLAHIRCRIFEPGADSTKGRARCRGGRGIRHTLHPLVQSSTERLLMAVGAEERACVPLAQCPLTHAAVYSSLPTPSADRPLSPDGVVATTAVPPPAALTHASGVADDVARREGKADDVQQQRFRARGGSAPAPRGARDTVRPGRAAAARCASALRTGPEPAVRGASQSPRQIKLHHFVRRIRSLLFTSLWYFATAYGTLPGLTVYLRVSGSLSDLYSHKGDLAAARLGTITHFFKSEI